MSAIIFSLSNNLFHSAAIIISGVLLYFLTFIIKILFMNKILLILGFFLFSSGIAYSQADYKVVFDLTSKDSMDQQSVIRWLKEITSAEPDARLEVVMYGKGLELAVQGKSKMATDVTQLAKNDHISFKVCSIAMKNQNIDKSQLLPGVETVPDGIYEVISKQRQGWGYIKVKN